MLQFGILGPLRVLRADDEVDLGRAQQRLLVARLLIDRNRTVAVDRLVADLWGERPPPSAVESLQAFVSRLRRVMEPDRGPREPACVLVTQGHGYSLRATPQQVDADRFEELVRRGRARLGEGAYREALDDLDAALGLWHGEVLDGFADHAFVVPTAVRLTELRCDAVQERAHARIECGDLATAIAELQEVVASQPLHERPWELLIGALHRAGRTGEALARHRQVRDLLAQELGLEPGSALLELERSILRGDLAGVGLAEAGPAMPQAGPSRLRQPARAATPAPAGTELVGRDAELELLSRALAAVRTGGTTWAVLAGDPGIGKTRLAREAAARVADGARVIWGRCHEGDGAPAFWPWLQILRGLEDLVAGAGALLGEQGAASVDAAGRRFSAYDRVAQAFATAASRTPLVLVCDDVQWADEESVGLLEFLAVQLREVPVGVVLTLRAGEDGPLLRHALGTISRSSAAVRIDLHGLDHAATATLAAGITGVDLDEQQSAILHQRTGGNPFFVAELSRLGADTCATAVPEGVRAVVERRLAVLSDESRSLLTLAAVSGQAFSLDVLSVAAGAADEQVLDLLDDAMAARLLLPAEQPGQLRFAHALIRDAVLDRLTDLQQRRLHLRLATAVRELAGADPTRSVPELAYHLLEAAPLGDPRAALEAAHAAAALASRRLAFTEATRWLERALGVLDGDRRVPDHARRCWQLLVALGRARSDAGDHAGALASLGRAIDVADELGDPVAMADAVVAMGRSGGFWYWVGERAYPVQLLERVDRTLAALSPDDLANRARVLGVRASGEYYGDVERAVELAEEAVAVARRTGDPVVLADVLPWSLQARIYPHELPTHGALVDELVAVAVEQARPEAELFACIVRYLHRISVCDVAAASQAHSRALELAERLGLVLVQAQLRWGTAALAQVRGDLAAAERLIEDARQLHSRTALYALERAHAQALVLLRWEQGRVRELPLALVACLADELPEAEVVLAAERGDLVEARRRLAEVCAVPLRPSYEWLGIMLMRARVAADVVCDPAAPAAGASGTLADLVADLEAELAPYAGCVGGMGTVTFAGPVSLQLGRLRSLLGRHDEAVATLRACLLQTAEQDVPVWRCRTQEALATALRARDKPTDAEEARTLAGAAARLASRLGLAPSPRLPAMAAAVGIRVG